MKVHLVDGTYELFRHYYAVPQKKNRYGQEIGATRGVVGSILQLLSEATHIGVATDHVIESFRNLLWADYKDGTGIAPDLFSQFGLLEDALQSLGVVVWPMVEYEADDALAAAAKICVDDPRVEQVLICTPDKDLAQCVSTDRVVMLDRRRKRIIDADAVLLKFGVLPESIPDYLALVGDNADGYPGVAGWGAISASRVLRKFQRLENIPAHVSEWRVDVSGAGRLSAIFNRDREQALLFRQLATLVVDGPVDSTVDELRWIGPLPDFAEICARLEAPELLQRAQTITDKSRPYAKI